MNERKTMAMNERKTMAMNEWKTMGNSMDDNLLFFV